MTTQSDDHDAEVKWMRRLHERLAAELDAIARASDREDSGLLRVVAQMTMSDAFAAADQLRRLADGRRVELPTTLERVRSLLDERNVSDLDAYWRFSARMKRATALLGGVHGALSRRCGTDRADRFMRWSTRAAARLSSATSGMARLDGEEPPFVREAAQIAQRDVESWV